MYHSLRAALTMAVVVAACGGASRSDGPPTSPTAGARPSEPAGVATAPPRTNPPISGEGPCIDGITLPAGRRSISALQTETPFGVDATFSDGWKGCGLAFKELGEPGGLMMLGYWDARMVYPDPCHWRKDVGGAETGDGVDALMAALSDQKLSEAGPIQDVSIDGYQGRYVRLEVPTKLDTSGCDSDQIREFRFWNGPGESVWWLGAADAPGLIGEVWALDVDDFRFVIQAASFSDAGELRRDELHRIVESIDIRP